MKLRKLYRIAVENYYFSLYSGQSEEDVTGWEYGLEKLHEKMVACGQEEAAKAINNEVYWNM